MPDSFTTTGRPMTGALQRALDGITGSRRDFVIAAFERNAEGSPIEQLYRALITELQLCGLRETETRIEFRQMMQDSIPDGPPWPQATGPESGESGGVDA